MIKIFKIFVIFTSVACSPAQNKNMENPTPNDDSKQGIATETSIAAPKNADDAKYEPPKSSDDNVSVGDAKPEPQNQENQHPEKRKEVPDKPIEQIADVKPIVIPNDSNTTPVQPNKNLNQRTKPERREGSTNCKKQGASLMLAEMTDKSYAQFDFTAIFKLKDIDLEKLVVEKKSLSNGGKIKDNDILRKIKTATGYKFQFNNLPPEVTTLSIFWLYFDNGTPFVTYNLKNNEGFMTQEFDFEEVPIIKIVLLKGYETMSIYYVDLRK